MLLGGGVVVLQQNTGHNAVQNNRIQLLPILLFAKLSPRASCALPNLQVEPVDFQELQLISRIQTSVPLEEMIVFEGGLHGIILH